MITALTIVNNGDGTYTVTFSAAVTATAGAGITETGFAMYSPSNGTWTSPVYTGSASGNTVTYTDYENADDDTLFVMLTQPIGLTAAQPFETATPITTIS